MVSKVRPGASVLARMGMYHQLSRVSPLRESYAGKFFLATFVGMLVPLAVFILYLLIARADLRAMYPVLAALVLATFAGFLGTLWMLRELLAPVDLTVEALREYIDRRRLPDLPIDFVDRAGRLMEGTQYTILQLDETIRRLERVSDTDELTGVYNRRAGEKRLGEEVARAERDLSSFQLACFDIRGLGDTNERFGHSAGDACISHVAALLQLNTRRGDWVARWGGNAFMVGLHRNRALKAVVERLAQAVEAGPCEISAGVELRLRTACGVADYRFGSGAQGAVADVEAALYAAKELARHDGLSHVCYRAELDLSEPRRRDESARAAP